MQLRGAARQSPRPVPKGWATLADSVEGLRLWRQSSKNASVGLDPPPAAHACGQVSCLLG